MTRPEPNKPKEQSAVLVTSWWSNCLALMCLHQLVRFASGRELLVSQAGKSDEQMARFRDYLPAEVVEIDYPQTLLADDSVMREYLAREALCGREGVWFFDHDTFLLSPAEQWLDAADAVLKSGSACLSTRRPLPHAGVTQPVYWLSPARLPDDISSFDPVPFKPKASARRPDLHRHDGNLTRPGKDTLVTVREELEARGLVEDLPFEDAPAPASRLPPFPAHAHLGGLHLYTGPARPAPGMSPAFLDWRTHVVTQFESFFLSCPDHWLAVEEPELLQRHAEFFHEVRGSASGVAR